MLEKTCYRCKENKSLDDFHNSASTFDKKGIYCKKCQNWLVERKELKYKSEGPAIFPDKKVCSSCNEFKPVSQFVKNKRRRDGYHQYCKPCWRIYVDRAKRRQAMYNG